MLPKMNTNNMDIFVILLQTVLKFPNMEDVKNVKKDTLLTLKENVLPVIPKTGKTMKNLSSKIPS